MLTKKVAKEITPVCLRKPAKNQKFEAPPKLGKRYRRLPQTVGVLKPQTFNFYRLGKTGRERRWSDDLVFRVYTTGPVFPVVSDLLQFNYAGLPTLSR
ncbi:hypothetical protein [Rheinheimera sp. 4Y26]|uniref:hypothetical protein n=1 Tax=Rheinheimera sp. 4Y26 TaxID=2977811 RepID=UPI0021B0E5FB|nr:hypothetical protein [Rheinheimera sp. 4Y26]MCT6699266.1 hypothetical protein [Rheinheimera sp. 4Y26]